jgi:hypothetical protein
MLGTRREVLKATAAYLLSSVANSFLMVRVSNAASSIPTFAPLALGAGGWITGLDVHSDGTLICRTDTYGAYLGNVTAGTKWQQLLTVA